MTTDVVKDRRTLDRDRWLFMTGEVGRRGLVQSCPGVDVDRVDNLIVAMDLILAGRREEKAAVRGKGKSSEEGSELVRIDIFECSQP